MQIIFLLTAFCVSNKTKSILLIFQKINHGAQKTGETANIFENSQKIHNFQKEAIKYLKLFFEPL